MRKINRQWKFYFQIPRLLWMLACFFFINQAYGQKTDDCITIEIENITCHQNGANDVTDDTYSFELKIMGGNSKWETAFKGITYSGFYNAAYSFDSIPLLDGPSFLIFSDSINLNCLGAITVFPPSNCSSCINQQETLCEGDTLTLFTEDIQSSDIGTITSFQWYKDNFPIAKATDSILLVTEQGSYTLKIQVASQNCSLQSCCYFNVYKDSIPDAQEDIFTQCLGFILENSVANNDSNLNNSIYSVLNPPAKGSLQLKENGLFSYIPFNENTCFDDVFTYQVCNNNHKSCCDTASAVLYYTDTIPPTIGNIPADITTSCDELIPYPANIVAYDNCPRINVEIDETSTQGEDGCALHNYTLTRTWTATDACGNSAISKQLIEVRDITAPDIFRIYTLPNGKKMIAGVMENVNQNWKTISLPIDFPTTPLVFAQVITDNENSAVTTRIRNVSNSQFEVQLQEEQQNDNRHQRENVAWIAIESGNQTRSFPLETRKITLTDAWSQINFEESYNSFPNFFAAIQTTVDNDPATIRFTNPTRNSIDISIEEETSMDANTFHSSEQVALLGIEEGISLVNKDGHFFGETGNISAGGQWTTITTQHKYYNPVVIAGIPQKIDGDPGVVRVRKVAANSFEIQFQEWDYLDGNHSTGLIPYLVIEGSLPLETSFLCDQEMDDLELGKDIIAMDNCDANVALQYNETAFFEGNIKHLVRTWYTEDECSNATGLSQLVSCTGMGVQIKAILQGAMLGSTETNLMRDDLRKKNMLPNKEPYVAMEKFEHVGQGGGEECSPKLFDVSGEKAIVDWVFVEIKSAVNPGEVVATQSALLQRNGQLISSTGDSILYFDNLLPDNYHVAIRHRNHLKAETKHPYYFSETNIPLIDFTYPFLPVIGNEPFSKIDGKNALWAGDLNQDEETIYQGPKNDVFNIFLEVLTDTLNKAYLANFIHPGYTVNDFNLDGITIYQGPNNDRANLLFNTTLRHPDNGLSASNYIISTTTTIATNTECQIDKTLAGCDFDGDGKLNINDIDDDNDGVVDGNDVNPYNINSDSDSDGLRDIAEIKGGSDPLNSCDPFQGHTTCQGKDEDRDGKFGNYPSTHHLYDANDLDACIPTPQAINCGCPDIDSDGFIFVCHTTKNGQKQTLKITLEQWRLRQAIGDICGKCQ